MIASVASRVSATLDGARVVAVTAHGEGDATELGHFRVTGLVPAVLDQKAVLVGLTVVAAVGGAWLASEGEGVGHVYLVRISGQQKRCNR